jgi:hypothetical protein
MFILWTFISCIIGDADGTDVVAETANPGRNTDGRKNLSLVNENLLLQTSWRFHPHIPLRCLSVAGYIFCPPKSETCSGALVTKQSIDLQAAASAKVDSHTAANLQKQYTEQASVTQINCI